MIYANQEMWDFMMKLDRNARMRRKKKFLRVVKFLFPIISLVFSVIAIVISLLTLLI